MCEEGERDDSKRPQVVDGLPVHVVVSKKQNDEIFGRLGQDGLLKRRTNQSERGNLVRPKSAKIEGDTCSCSYDGCGQRFKTPQELAKHKLDMHQDHLLARLTCCESLISENLSYDVINWD